ncbi:MAG: sugar transferase [Rhodothalassiaceae bacterium]
MHRPAKNLSVRDTRAARRVKRLFDMVAAAGILVLLSPVLLILAVAVKMSSPGPIMTRQERLGQGGCAFLLHKFRTLHRGGEQGSAVAVRGDARVTPLGRWLRRTRLDELPQLIDVLRGKMSLVGPRPEVPHLLADVPRDVRDTVLSVRPGVTGPAAIDFLCADEVLDGMAEPEMLYIRHIAPLKHQMEAE